MTEKLAEVAAEAEVAAAVAVVLWMAAVAVASGFAATPMAEAVADVVSVDDADAAVWALAAEVGVVDYQY